MKVVVLLKDGFEELEALSVVDVLRQFTTIENVPEALVFTAREAIDKIQREPVDLD